MLPNCLWGDNKNSYDMPADILGTEKFVQFMDLYKTTEYIRQTGKNWKRLEIPGSLVMMLDSGIFYGEI